MQEPGLKVEMTETKFNLPMEADSVPDDAFGIYAFRICLPNDARLGLTATNADPIQHATELVRRAQRLKSAISDDGLTGRVRTRQAPHLCQSFTIHAEPDISTYHIESLHCLISELGGDIYAVKTAAAVLRYTIEMSLPLYVGMTSKQSFRQRLDQHMNGSSQFSDRLKELRITWSDLQFSIRPLAVPRRAVMSAERLAQTILRPRASLA